MQNLTVHMKSFPILVKDGIRHRMMNRTIYKRANGGYAVKYRSEVKTAFPYEFDGEVKYFKVQGKI